MTWIIGQNMSTNENASRDNFVYLLILLIRSLDTSFYFASLSKNRGSISEFRGKSGSGSAAGSFSQPVIRNIANIQGLSAPYHDMVTMVMMQKWTRENV
ncbi:uncharacterized protein EAF01_007375 [Botrytis porri]|uniref:Uncharacterized protein n=1 Tax=Botrytis porri TaxID=87229 RepID=A0A4Z1L672_9HELO|nr:uncharacterized protein EAF01_007375 [Botrytis porri]KAF7902077.1 hypothetical protein EAF01_007375 [Botrytis porri]TGO92381.1 hypothetical protein BPOR_0004g00260 [Botrytis porri]